MKIPRNAACPCGSGRKFKKCHLGREDELFAEPDRLTSPIEIPDTIPGVAEAIREAEHFWHQCVLTYNEPEDFRVNLNALVQAIRNVTFRVQAGKAAVGNFDAWYFPWREFLRQDPLMRWLNEARIAVVKQSGLETLSTAQVTLVASYLEGPGATLRGLPASLPNEELADRLAARVSRELLGNSAIEIERRWEVDSLPGIELLDVLAECLRILVGLVRDLDAHLRGGPVPTPEEAAAGTEMPPPLIRTREARRLRINPLTGEHYTHQDLFMPSDPDIMQRAAKRYRLSRGEISWSDDPIELAKNLFPLAARMLQRDGYHTPIVFLHHPEQGWHRRIVHTEDKLDKFLAWRRYGEEVEDFGYDGVVFITEAWGAGPSVALQGPYPDFEHAPDRTELLNISASTSDGRRLILNAEFHRRFGRIVKVDPPYEGTPEGPWFLSPLERAWSARGTS
jgi:hypothetical protein